MKTKNNFLRLGVAMLVAIGLSAVAMAQDSRLVGMWQVVVNVDKTAITLGPVGKVFLPDGRIFGYALNPADFQNYSLYNFNPWLFGKYTINSDSTYTEQIFLHQDPNFEGSLEFKFQVLNNHALLTQYVLKTPDGSPRPVTELWIKMAKGKDEEEKVLKQVKDNWDTYVQRAQELFGRM